MNRPLDPGRMRLPPVRDLVEEATAQSNAWGWILKDPRFPELQYFVPYPMVSHGPPPAVPQSSIAGIPQTSNRALPPLSTAPTPVFYYPIPLEQMSPDSNRVTPLPPLRRAHSQASGSHALIPTSSSMGKTRTLGHLTAASTSSPVSDVPASISPSLGSFDQNPGTPSLDDLQESSPAEQPSPTPTPTPAPAPVHSHPHSARPQRTTTTTIPGRAPTIRIVQFLDVTAHTAKCDDCDRRNREGMIRCCICGWQCCRNCQNNRGGSRTHRSFQSVHVASQAEADRAAQSDAAHALVRMNARSAAPGSSRVSRHHRRRSLSPQRSLDSDDTISHPSLADDSADEFRTFGGRERRNPPRCARPEGFAE